MSSKALREMSEESGIIGSPPPPLKSSSIGSETVRLCTGVLVACPDGRLRASRRLRHFATRFPSLAKGDSVTSRDDIGSGDVECFPCGERGGELNEERWRRDDRLLAVFLLFLTMRQGLRLVGALVASIC